MESPSSLTRESMTWVSSALQKGHFTRALSSSLSESVGGAHRRAVDRKLRAQRLHRGAAARQGSAVGARLQHVGDEVGDLHGFLVAKSARGHRRGAHTDAAGDEGLLGIIWNRILVPRDMGGSGR